MVARAVEAERGQRVDLGIDLGDAAFQRVEQVERRDLSLAQEPNDLSRAFRNQTLLRQERHARIGEARDGARRLGREFTRMIGVNGDIYGEAAAPQRLDEGGRDPLRRGDRNAAVKARHAHMRRRGEPVHQRGDALGRQGEGIASGHDDLADLRMRPHIIQRRVDLGLRQRAGLSRSHHFAPEAEAAIDRADMDDLEQRPVGIAVHEARNRRIRPVADRVVEF